MISFFNALRSEKRIQYLVRSERLESRYGTQPRAHSQQKEAQSSTQGGKLHLAELGSEKAFWVPLSISSRLKLP